MSIKRQLRLLYISVFFQNFVFWYAIEKPFLKSIGFSDAAIALETIIFMSVLLVANIPFGMLSDRWSRKGVLSIASIMLALGCLVCGLSNSVFMYIVGISIWALYSACYSGSYESIIYDLLQDKEGEKTFTRSYGQLRLIASIGLVTSSLVGGILGELISLRAAYLLSVPLALVALIPLYYVNEPKKHFTQTNNIWSHFQETLAAVLKVKALFWIVLCLIAVSVITNLIQEFGSLWLVAAALPILLFGPVTALMQTSIGLGGWLAGRVKDISSVGLFISVSLLCIGGLLTQRSLPLLVLALIALVLGLVMLQVLYTAYLQDVLASKVRAGATSVVSTLGVLVFLPIAYLFGQVSDQTSIFYSGWIVMAILVLLCGCTLGLLAQMNKKAKAAIS